MHLFPPARRRIKNTCLVLGALFIGAATRLFGASYYVDYSAGADANSGTSTSAPWQHCPGDPAASAVAAITSLMPGDTVIFKGGVTYVLTGTTGIAVRASGAAGSPITYDGNSAGAWGTGRARFTDNCGANGLAAFSAAVAVSNLKFTNLELGAIGGSAVLPLDSGYAVPARPGTGLSFTGGISSTIIDGCVFHDLGYSYNQKPMNTASIVGAGISATSASSLTISNCDFSHVASGIELYSATSLANVTISGCTFHDSVCWTIDLPPPPVTATNLSVSGCTETNNGQFTSGSWTGYGSSPRTDVQSVTAGANVTLNVSAAASPAATFQWFKNGIAISGATNATYALTSVTTNDAATYTVVATNTAGTGASNDAVLTVTAAAIAPAITTQPIAQTVASGSSVSFTVSASGTPTPTYQWLKNGTPVSGATSATLMLASVTSSDAGTYSAVATNTAGSVTSTGATLTVSSPTPPPAPTPTPPPPTTTSSAPVITSQPVSQTVYAGTNVLFSVVVAGSPTPTLQWMKDGAPIPGATSNTLSLTSVTLANAGTYSVVATNSAGTSASSGATLVVNTATAPVIATQPMSQTVANKSNVTFSVTATGTPTLTYQWSKNWVPINGATGSSLTLTNVTKADAGTYIVTVTNASGTARSNAAVLSVSANGKLSNLSVRATAGTASNTLVVGFVVSGSSSKSLLLRGVGPTLRTFGVSSPLANPLLSLYRGDTLLDANSNWNAGANAPKVAAMAADVGAFALPASSEDTALTPTLQPGAYTAQLTGAAGETGTGLVELYDATDDLGTRFVNASVRTFVGPNTDSPIIGFVVNGTEPKRLLVRAIGPGLAKFGVDGVLADPQVAIFQGSTQVQQNDNWGGDAALTDAFASVGAFALSDPDSKDSAFVFTAAPGAYTAVVSGANNTSGVVLVEVYELP